MQDDKIFNKIIQTLSRIINIDEKQITMNSDIKNTPNWDSVNHVFFVIQICDVFSIEFCQENILDFTSVRKIYNYIKKGEKR